MFSIAPYFYPIYFVKCCPPFPYISGPKGGTPNFKIKPFILGRFHGFIFKKYFEGNFGQGSKVQGAILLIKNFKLVPRPLDKGPKSKNGKLRLNLHGNIWEAKSIGLEFRRPQTKSS
jgi:hypothetical protein